MRPRRITLLLLLVTVFVIPARDRALAVEASDTTPPAAAAKQPTDESPQPSSKLSPEDVVRQQMRALTGEGTFEQRVERCYRFASPTNRFHVGSLKPFAKMLKSPEYEPLLNAQHFLVGRAAIVDREAHVLVTVVDSKVELRLFRWFLSKQKGEQYKDCWMTDAVVPVGVANPPERFLKPPAPPI